MGPDGREVEHMRKAKSSPPCRFPKSRKRPWTIPNLTGGTSEVSTPIQSPLGRSDLKAKLLAVLDQAEGYRVLAIRSRDRGERESYEHIVELYVKIAEELETMLDG